MGANVELRQEWRSLISVYIELHGLPSVSHIYSKKKKILGRKWPLGDAPFRDFFRHRLTVKQTNGLAAVHSDGEAGLQPSTTGLNSSGTGSVGVRFKTAVMFKREERNAPYYRLFPGMIPRAKRWCFKGAISIRPDSERINKIWTQAFPAHIGHVRAHPAAHWDEAGVSWDRGPTCSHCDWSLCPAVQALTLPCLSSRAFPGSQVNMSMLTVRKILEAVIW